MEMNHVTTDESSLPEFNMLCLKEVMRLLFSCLYACEIFLMRCSLVIRHANACLILTNLLIYGKYYFIL